MGDEFATGVAGGADDVMVGFEGRFESQDEMDDAGLHDRQGKDAEDDVSVERRRGGGDGAGGFCRQSLGTKIPRHRAKLPSELGAGDPVSIPEAVRRTIYTTNAIEALNAKLRRAVRTRGHFPNEFAATKYLFLVPVSRLAPGRRRVENVAERAVRGKDSIRYYVRRTVGSSVMAQRAPYTRFLTLPPRSVAGAT